MLYTKSITLILQLCYTKATWQAGVYWSAVYSITQLHQVFVQFQKHTHLQIFRESVTVWSSRQAAAGNELKFYFYLKVSSKGPTGH